MNTTMATFDVPNELYNNWNDKLYSGCVFIDFCRTFDSIDHKIGLLSEKLKLFANKKNTRQ